MSFASVGKELGMMILHEGPEHVGEIRRVTEEAFSASEFGHNGEASLIEVLRAASNEIVSLVALEDDEVVGHILFSPSTIRCGDKELRGMGLGPMAVVPTHQRIGIGSRLVVAGLRELKKRGSQFTVVAGHPGFYQRFGFCLASDFRLMHGFAGMPQEVFFVHADDTSCLGEFDDGQVFYHSAFGPQHQP